MNRLRIIAFLMALAAILSGRAQDTKMSQLSLKEAITVARLNSVDAIVTLNELKTAYWQYKTFKADLLPEVNFSATVPNYNKSYQSYQNADGSYDFVRNNSLGLWGELSIDQNLWFTGGKISLTSSLDFMKTLSGDKNKHYMSIPVSLKLTQPIFAVNRLKWNRRIEPLRYKEAKAAFISKTEEVTMQTITYYFDLLLAKENLLTAQQNRKNAAHLYEVAIIKREMGQVSENELMQLKLSALNSKAALTDAESNLKSKMFRLRSFLGLSEEAIIDPVLPQELPPIAINYEVVLNKALQNNSFALNIRRRQLEADFKVAEAKGELRKIDLFANIGYTGENSTFSKAYRNLQDNQVIEVGVKIPILDWGKRRGKVRVAQSNREVIVSKIKRDQLNFNQDIFLLVEHFNNQAQQLAIAQQSDKIAQRRYRTSVESFLIGKINTLDLNDAQKVKDEARQKHISELYSYWYYFYQIRSLTLWDFVRNCELEVDFDGIVK